jgi:L-cysteine S-thiosulfotransferase
MNARLLLLLTSVLVYAACAHVKKEPTPSGFEASFKDRGIAKVERLQQSELQLACSKYNGANLPAELRTRLEKAAQAKIAYPSDGKWLGEWKQGERIAQSGVGMQWSDRPDTVNGGNCYACHQLSPREISYGNIGPSLYMYGKQRGISEATLTYTWGKIWNAHAFNACSSMPRFGDAGILNEQQIKHLMALLLDPESPVNLPAQ